MDIVEADSLVSYRKGIRLLTSAATFLNACSEKWNPCYPRHPW